MSFARKCKILTRNEAIPFIHCEMCEEVLAYAKKHNFKVIVDIESRDIIGVVPLE